MTNDKFESKKEKGDIKQINEYPDYWAQDNGEIYSTKFGRIKKLKPIFTSQNLYKAVVLFNAGQKKMFYVHTIILECFICPRPPGKICLHGENGRLDNSTSNLTWGSYRQNSLDRERDGTNIRGEDNVRSKLNLAAIEIIRSLPGIVSNKTMATAFGVSHQHISSIIRGKSWAEF